MAAAPEGLARRGGVGGFDRRIVDAEGRRHLPRIGAPHHGELFAGESAAVLVRKRGGGWHGAALSTSRPAEANSGLLDAENP
jgi:hypothetical protein